SQVRHRGSSRPRRTRLPRTTSPGGSGEFRRRPMTSAVPTEGHGHSARRSFEEALQGAKDDTLRLGAMVEHQLERAGMALQQRDAALAAAVRLEAAQVNELQRSL